MFSQSEKDFITKNPNSSGYESAWIFETFLISHYIISKSVQCYRLPLTCPQQEKHLNAGHITDYFLIAQCMNYIQSIV